MSFISCIVPGIRALAMEFNEHLTSYRLRRAFDAGSTGLYRLSLDETAEVVEG